MRSKYFLYACAAMVFIASFTSCVPKRQLIQAQTALQSARTDSNRLANRVTELEKSLADLTEKSTMQLQSLKTLKEQLDMTSKDAAGKIASQQTLLNKSQEEILSQQKKLESLQGLLEQQKKNADPG
jgi:chemotaxis protein MotB